MLVFKLYNAKKEKIDSVYLEGMENEEGEMIQDPQQVIDSFCRYTRPRVISFEVESVEVFKDGKIIALLKPFMKTINKSIKRIDKETGKLIRKSVPRYKERHLGIETYL